MIDDDAIRTDDPKEDDTNYMNSTNELGLKANIASEQVTIRPRRIQITLPHRISRRISRPKVNVRISVIDPKPHKCPVHDCKYAGKEKHYLARHMKRHAKEKLLTCGSCPKMFREPNDLDEHIREHMELVCSICSKMFESQNEIIAHGKACKKSKLFSCKLCTKKFKQRHKLIEHRAVHKDLSK